LSPADTTVLPMVLEDVSAGLAKPMRAGLLATVPVTEKLLAAAPSAAPPRPKSVLKLTPVAPRWVESPVTFSP